MDALALLSGEEDEDDDEEPDAEEDEGEVGSAAAGSSIEPAIDFRTLRRAGYEANAALSESEMYKRLGAVAAPPPAKEEAAEAAAPPAASGVVSAKADIDAQMKADLEAMIKSRERNRKRAGLKDGPENNRQKNARKMKMGQASFSLKDDRDCTNPFVDSSTSAHVQNFTGKRVDKRASVKQISNLDFTS